MSFAGRTRSSAAVSLGLGLALITMIGVREADATTPHGVSLRVYPGAHHGFDSARPVGPYRSHTIGRHPEAAAKAEEEVQRFLIHYLSTIQPTSK